MFGKKEKGKQVYTFKVTLEGSDPPIWRRFQIEADATLGDLHDALQGVMGWTDDHLHEFIIRRRSYGMVDPDDMNLERYLDEEDFILRDLFKRKDFAFTYIYDFGDCWHHEIIFEDKSEANPEVTYPLCIDGARSCPPEDCGGMYGYYNMLDILQDPSDEEYETYREWLSEDFDPEFFDIDLVNKDLHGERLPLFFDDDDEEEEDETDADDDIPVAGNYTEPVCQLLKLGEPKNPVDYQVLGIGREHVPELIQMVLDMELHQSTDSRGKVWGPTHAWRALGQLRAEEAVEALVQLMALTDEMDDDWVMSDLPYSVADIGAPAIPALTSLLKNDTKGLYARGGAGDTLKIIAEKHPETYDECVAILTDQLEQYEDNAPELNAFIIDSLMNLEAVESAPVIERAFSDRCVSVEIVGDWQDVQIELGLLDKRTSPKIREGWHNPKMQTATHPKSGQVPSQPGKKQKQAKNKRKEQKNARKKNRRK